MAYTVYATGSVSDFRERKDNNKLGFWCYYLRTDDHTELQCDVIEDDESITAPRMQLVALIEALKRCKNSGSKDTVKIYATNQQYLELCFQNPDGRKKNWDLWEQIDKLQLDKNLIGFPGDLDTSVAANRGMKIVKTALKDIQEYNKSWQSQKNKSNMKRIF